MKRNLLFLLIVVCLSPVFSMAQRIPKSSLLLGGTLGFGKQTTDLDNADDSKFTSVNINPSAGVFYRDNRAVGINIYYSRGASSNKLTLIKNYGAGVYLRQYMPIGKSFNLFAEEGASYSNNNQNFRNGTSFVESDHETKTAAVYFYPGIAYGVTRHFQLELSLPNLVSFQFQKINDANTDYGGNKTSQNTKDLSLATGITTTDIGLFRFGVKWLLGNKQG